MRLKPMIFLPKKQNLLFSIGLLLFSGETFAMEFSAGVGALHNAKMSFTSPALNMTATPLAASNPGSDNLANLEDRTYDDGYVLEDSRVGAPNTVHWGCDNQLGQIIQNDANPNLNQGDEVRMTSLQSSTFFSESGSNEEVDAEADNSIFLNMDFPVHKGETFSWGVRTGLSYTRMEGDQRAQVEGLDTVVSIQDTYELLGGVPPNGKTIDSGPWDGIPVYAPNTPILSRLPNSRTTVTNSVVSTALSREQEMQLDMVALDLGLYGAYSPFKRLKLHLAGGLSVMHIHSVLAYRNEWNGVASNGEKSENQLLFGANIQGGATVKFDPETEKGFGLFGNVTYRRMEEFKTDVDGYEATLDFDDAVQFSVGMNYVF